jgi:hypothetical protein
MNSFRGLETIVPAKSQQGPKIFIDWNLRLFGIAAKSGLNAGRFCARAVQGTAESPGLPV